MLNIILKSLRKAFKFNISSRRKYAKATYSQCGEDIIIDHILGDRIPFPTYIDIGAHHPWNLNNTALFYLRGGRGINVEPDPYFYDLLSSERKKDINLNIGISDTTEAKDFYIMSAPTLNTFSKEATEKFEKNEGYSIMEVKKIEVDTLTGIIDKHFNGKHPDMLSIDVEGLEFEILKTVNFEKDPPKVVCLETISFSDTGHGIKDQKLIEFVCSKGYINYADTNINTIFVLKNFWKR